MKKKKKENSRRDTIAAFRYELGKNQLFYTHQQVNSLHVCITYLLYACVLLNWVGNYCYSVIVVVSNEVTRGVITVVRSIFYVSATFRNRKLFFQSVVNGFVRNRIYVQQSTPLWKRIFDCVASGRHTASVSAL